MGFQVRSGQVKEVKSKLLGYCASCVNKVIEKKNFIVDVLISVVLHCQVQGKCVQFSTECSLKKYICAVVPARMLVLVFHNVPLLFQCCFVVTMF